MALEHPRRRQINDLIVMLKSRLDTDILAECLAALLIQNQLYEEDEIHIIPTFNYKRNYEFDLVTILDNEEDDLYRSYFQDSDKHVLQLASSRSGILDYLPEPFYVNPYDEEPPEAAFDKTVRERYRKEKKLELESAIRFFKPLEIEFNRVRVQRELQELALLEDFDTLLSLFWNIIPDYISEESEEYLLWKRFVRSLHLVPFVVGDMEKTQILMEFVLGKGVELELRVDDQVSLPEEYKVDLGELVLGHNFSVGNVIYCYNQICTVKIKGLTSSEFYQYYAPDSPIGELLHEIKKYYFPIDSEIEFQFELSQEGVEFSLGEGILGFATKL